MPEQLPARTWLPDWREVVVVFDFSETAMNVLRKLFALAANTGLQVHLLCVTDTTAVRERDRVYTQRMSRMLNRCLAKMGGGQVATRSSVLTGDPAEVIISYARTNKADLIVTTTKGFGGLRDVFSTSTAEQVTSKSPCPVFVFNESTVNRLVRGAQAFPGMGWKLLLMPVCVDSFSGSAVKLGAALARESGSVLRLIHVIEPKARDGRQSGSEAERLIRQSMQMELPDFQGCQVTVSSGVPFVHAILLEARRCNADIMILPSQHRHWAKRFQIASATDSILRHAPCGVLSLSDDGL